MVQRVYKYVTRVPPARVRNGVGVGAGKPRNNNNIHIHNYILYI